MGIQGYVRPRALVAHGFASFSLPSTSKRAKALFLVWVLVVVTTFAGLWKYKLTPGASGDVVRAWPTGSHLLHRPGRPTLVFFAHPRCPCTRASLAELNRIMGAFAGKLTAEVVFLNPSGEPEAWSHTDSFERALAVPGVRVTVDRDGREASPFGATTSGHVVLYDREGVLLFSGGITPARGHEGDSLGRERLVELLERETGPRGATRPVGTAVAAAGPVYGCSLEDGPP